MIATRINTTQVVQRAASGCSEAWQMLFSEFRHRLYGFVFAECRCHTLAEEITQITFVKALKALPRYREQGCFVEWLIRIAANALRDERRRIALRPMPIDFTDLHAIETCEYGRLGRWSGGSVRMNAEVALAAERRELIAKSFTHLHPMEKRILVRRYWWRQSSSVIAAETGIPLGTVLSRAHRALEKLKCCFNEN